LREYRHYVSGFFAQGEEAERALSRLVELGLPRERLRLLATDSAPPPPESQAHSNEVLRDILVDGAVGTAIGTGMGAITELALVAANVSLFVASPLIAPLALLGWGAGLGGFLGAAAGAGSREGGFSALIRDAISSGQVVLVAETRTAPETATARRVIQAWVGDYADISAT
jgi:hypothetical protein